MILADVRRNLTRKDAELAARLLARDSEAELRRLEARLAEMVRRYAEKMTPVNLTTIKG